MERIEFEKMCQRAGIKKEALCDTVFTRQFRDVKKIKSVHAEVAQTIRKELKEKYPNIKFSVRSRSFTGGDDVRISYDNAMPSKDIEKITNKYATGSFDGMTDMYNYDYDKTGPTAKYIFVEKHITNEVWEKTKKEIALYRDIKDINNEQEWFNKFGCWSSAAVHRELVNKTL